MRLLPFRHCDRCGDGDLALDFFFVEVGNRVTFIRPGQTVNSPGCIEKGGCEHRFPAMPVAHDTDIAYILAFVDFQGVWPPLPGNIYITTGRRPKACNERQTKAVRIVWDHSTASAAGASDPECHSFRYAAPTPYSIDNQDNNRRHKERSGAASSAISATASVEEAGVLQEPHANSEKHNDRYGMDYIPKSHCSSTSNIRQAAPGNTNTRRSAEDARAQIGDAVRAQLFVSGCQFQRPVAALNAPQLGT